METFIAIESMVQFFRELKEREKGKNEETQCQAN